MKKGIVIYGSHYGATEQYAKEIARQLDFTCKNYKEINQLTDYDVIVIGGGHYAGSITGLAETMKKLTNKNSDVYIFTVGISSKNGTNLDAINDSIRKVVTPEQVSDDRIFYYRGGMNLKEISFIHRTMMKMMIHMIKKKPKEELTEDDKGVIALKEKPINFIDLTQVNDIVSVIKG